MKKISLCLLVAILCSCHGKPITDHKISSKYYTNFWGEPMPKGICRFYYHIDEDGCIESIEDSCHFYKVGDKLNH